MKSIVLTFVGSFMLWMLVGCDGFLDEYSITEVRPTELTDVEQLLLPDKKRCSIISWIFSRMI